MLVAFRAIRAFLRDRKATNGIEYSLLSGLMASAFVFGSSTLGASLNTLLDNTSKCLNSLKSTECSRLSGSGSGTGSGSGAGTGGGSGAGTGAGSGAGGGAGSGSGHGGGRGGKGSGKSNGNGRGKA